MVYISSTRPDLYFLKIVEFSHYNEYGVGGGSRARDATKINDVSTSQNENQYVPRGNASNDSTRNQVRSNRGSIGLRQRIIPPV